MAAILSPQYVNLQTIFYYESDWFSFTFDDEYHGNPIVWQQYDINTQMG